MLAQKWSETQPVLGTIPDDPFEYFFISPERFRQQIEPNRVFGANMPRQAIIVEHRRLFPANDRRWDGKTDDVWSYGCLTFFMLTGNYPFEAEHRHPRALILAFRANHLTRVIREHEGLTELARQFLLWILKPDQQERPTMEQVVNHPWLQNKHPTSPHKQDYLSDKPEIYGRTFKQVTGYINEELVKQMAGKGYMIQHLLGEGGFGAVYK